MFQINIMLIILAEEVRFQQSRVRVFKTLSCLLTYFYLPSSITFMSYLLKRFFPFTNIASTILYYAYTDIFSSIKKAKSQKLFALNKHDSNRYFKLQLQLIPTFFFTSLELKKKTFSFASANFFLKTNKKIASVFLYIIVINIRFTTLMLH